MSGYVFLCNSSTERECLQRLLFGTSNSKVYAEQFKDIRIGDWLFLYNYQQHTLRGLYRALSGCGEGIEPDAWKDAKKHGFPFQIRVSADGEYKNPLLVHEIEPILPLYQTKVGRVPPSKLSSEDVQRLVKALQKKNDDFTPVHQRIPQEQLTSRSYIFRCSRVTGGKCFSDNVMGAPVSLFRPLVSGIQQGDTIFLWLIEERRLYGAWKAKSRGQYDPTAFGGEFSAVVYCDRLFDIESGLDEKTLRGIVPFDSTMPPYRIRYEQSEALIDALLSTNPVSRRTDKEKREVKFQCEDGHLVRSYSEIIIDNWLYNHHICHAYEHRVQIGSSFLRCDFYIPTKKVFIEFWGLVGDPNYDSQRKKKKEMYTQAGVQLLELFPMDIPVLSEVLPAKLAQFGISTLLPYGKNINEISHHLHDTQRVSAPQPFSDRRSAVNDEKPKITPPGVDRSKDGKIYMYEISKHGILAKMVIRDGLYTVLKDSTASGQVKASMAEGQRHRREELIRSGKLVRKGSLYAFTCDVSFNSPSEASGVVSGSSTNGWLCFKIPRQFL